MKDDIDLGQMVNLFESILNLSRLIKLHPIFQMPMKKLEKQNVLLTKANTMRMSRDMCLKF